MLTPFNDKFVRAFLDDICVYTSKKEHADRLEQVFRRMDEAGGQLNLEKCFLGCPKVKLLGHVVS